MCDRCEGIYASGDDDAAVEVMRTSSGGWGDDEDDSEYLRKPLEVFRRADLGARPLDPEPPALLEARKQGFVPFRELTGVGDRLGPLWPAGHRLWLDELGGTAEEGEYDDEPDCWVVRSPWPSLSVPQTLSGLWPVGRE